MSMKTESVSVPAGHNSGKSSASQYEVFLSHNSNEKPAVELIGRRLQNAGFTPFLDKWHLIPGQKFQPELTDALDRSACVAVFFGKSGSSPWHNEEMQYALNKAVRTRDDYRVIPVLLPGSDSSQIEGFLGLRTWIDFRSGLDDEPAFQRLVAGIKGVAPDSAEGLLVLPDEPRPYRGIAHFDQAHHSIYFGRDAEIKRLTAQLESDHFVAVVGGSGSGKSSLVRSGLYTDIAEQILPGVRASHRIVFMPGKNPLLQLAASLLAHLPEADRLSLGGKLIEGFTAGKDGLINALTMLFQNHERPILLVVDQFEELLTQRPQIREEQPVWRAGIDSFTANLRAAVDSDPDWLRVVVTLRADFLDRFVDRDFPDFRLLLERRQFWVTPMSHDDIREVVVRPAAMRGAFLEKGLVERILSEMRGQPTALPLLEEALDIMWDKRRGPWLTHQAYDEIGGVGGALASKADRIFESLNTAQQSIARRIFPKLIQLGEGARDTRRRVPFAELISVTDDPSQFQFVLDKFSGLGARLIALSSNSEDLSGAGQTERTAEVAHEALIDHWGRLARWLNEKREDLRLDRRLTESAQRWEKEAKKEDGKPDGLLWRPPELVIGREYVVRAGDSVTKLQLSFIEHSRRAENARRRRRWFAVLGSLFTLFAFASAYLIATAAPDVWERVPQPDRTEQFTFKKFLPVHDIAINRNDPSIILYLGGNADLVSAKFSITPDSVPPEFSSRVADKLQAGDPVGSVARVKFEIFDEEEDLRGQGTIEITAGLDETGKALFFRRLKFEGKTTKDNGELTKTKVTAPTLLESNEDLFDLGEYAEYLASNELLVSDDNMRGTIYDLLSGDTLKVEYQMDDLLSDGYTSRERYWGAEYKIFSNVDAESIEIGGVKLSEREKERALWDEVVKLEDWATYQKPELVNVAAWVDPKPEDVVTEIPNGGDVQSLKSALGTLDWIYDYLDAAVLSSHTSAGRADALHLKWSQTSQGTGEMEEKGDDWVVRLGESAPWRVITLPDLDIQGIWNLGNNGQTGLLLTTEQGFYRTRDGGRSWEEANYNETGFTNGKAVKPIIVRGADATFALIDRGTSEDDGENPLFRLKHRSLLERWRTGLVQLLGESGQAIGERQS